VRQPLAQSYTRYYFAIFLLAASALSYQILITRFFSVVLFYHFAFGAISLAMLGLTRGAMEVYSNPIVMPPNAWASNLRCMPRGSPSAVLAL
jgi:hypothetical protein